jgi:long-chain acyl-CoA synthetase
MTNNNQLIDYSYVDSLPEIWEMAAEQFPDTIALYDPNSEPEIKLTYSELYTQIQYFAAGLQALEIKGKNVALFADNSPRWLIADQGSMMAGCVNAVRSSQAEKQELLYILKDSDSLCLIVENLKTLKKLKPEIDQYALSLIVLLSDEKLPENSPIRIVNFNGLLTLGNDYELEFPQFKKGDLATLIYTSGTTGQPKGVMLSHGNLLHQVNNLGVILQPKKGDIVLSLLPTWHCYERSCEYFLLSQGCTQIYSSLRTVKNDLKEYKPYYMVGVPRLWESVYDGIQKQFRSQPESKQKLINFFLQWSEKYIVAQRISHGLSLDHINSSILERFLAKITALLLKPIHLLGEKIVYQKIREATGGKIKTLISGGGSLARHLDTFYEIVNIPILVGYGLTETAPVTNVRTLDHNMRFTAGKPLPETEIRIVDPETKQTLPQGQTGLVLIRGSQVMQGYYHKPEATSKVIDNEGWFDSGDLGWLTPANDLVLTGRAKDTIVLTNGENIEPQPIEDACLRSGYIDQIMLVGQDQRSLGALIVPNLDALQVWANEQKVDFSFNIQELNQNKTILGLFRQELTQQVKNRPGYRSDDRIGPFYLILEPFSQENGQMTQTMKIKRPVVTQRYQDIISKMFEN